MVKRLKEQAGGGHTDRRGARECAGTSLRPTFPVENSITVVKEIKQNHFGSDVRCHWGLMHIIQWMKNGLDPGAKQIFVIAGTWMVC